MQEQEIIERIKMLCQSRSWTFYKLAKESGITYSTLCPMLHKANCPSIPTLIKICNAFNISLAQFFSIEDDTAYLSSEDKLFLQQLNQLTEHNKANARKYLDFLLYSQHENT